MTPWVSRAGIGAAEHRNRLRGLVPVRAVDRPAAVGEGNDHRGEPVARDPCALRRGRSWGRGGSAPRQPRRVIRRVRWLDALSLRQASVGTPPKSRSGHRPEQPRPGRRGPTSPVSGSPASRTAKATAARSAEPRFPPYPYPSETRDRQSSAIRWPVGYPKRLQTAPNRPCLETHRGGVRTSGPRDTLPSRP